MHDDLPQRGSAEQRQYLIEQLLADKGHHGAAVVDDVLHFLKQQHGVGRHQRRISAQSGEVGGDELRAVLAEHHHPIAAPYPAHLLQIAGHVFGIAE